MDMPSPTTPNPADNAPLAANAAAGRTVSLLGASAALACLFGLPSLAHATFIPPVGVADYRLIFVTADTTAATSSSIATYNSFATSEAALNASLPSTVWTAVASTDSASAVSNIACTPDCSHIPIYLVDGTEVAASSAALFNAATTSLLAGIGEDQYGSTINSNGFSYAGGYVWTGSFSTGLPAISAGPTDTTLGSIGGNSEYGLAGAVDGTAIDGGPWGNSNAYPIYAISGVIAAGQPVPEPVSALLLGFGALVTGWFGRRQRKPDAAV